MKSNNYLTFIIIFFQKILLLSGALFFTIFSNMIEDEEVAMELQEKLESSTDLVVDDFKELPQYEEATTQNDEDDESNICLDKKFWCAHYDCQSHFHSPPCEECTMLGEPDNCFCAKHELHAVHINKSRLHYANNVHDTQAENKIVRIANNYQHLDCYNLLKSIPNVSISVKFK